MPSNCITRSRYSTSSPVCSRSRTATCRQTVESLTRQLRREQSARLTELVKKERLGRRLSELLETLPGAILVIDGDGIVRQQNSQASALLNQPLIGCSWASHRQA